MILLIQNIEDYNNDLRVSLQAFYGGERIVVPEIFDKKPELKAEIDKELVADIDDNRINIELYSVETEESGLWRAAHRSLWMATAGIRVP